MLRFLTFTPREIIAYAECMRFTPDELRANRDLRGQFIGVEAYA